MVRIAILTSFVTPGTAVSNDVVAMHGALEGRGFDARVYAERATVAEPKVWPASEVTDFLTSPDDVLIYHHSIGWESGFDLLRAAKCRKVIRYHNVTPPEFFAGVSEWHERMCRTGREQLALIVDADYDLYLAASEFNSDELLSLGADVSKCFVCAPFHRIDGLQSIQPDLDLLDAYRDGKTNVLMVGHVAPHKGHRQLIEAFAVYHYKHNRDSRLLLVGPTHDSFAGYVASLRELVSFLWLEDAVVFTGEASDAALKAYYLTASAFALTSQHEGFCVPLVEAMAMNVPVVAYASSAIPDTIGGAGLVWQELNPQLLAESINLIVADESASFALALAGRRRYEQHFTRERIEASFFDALGELLW